MNMVEFGEGGNLLVDDDAAACAVVADGHVI